MNRKSLVSKGLAGILLAVVSISLGGCVSSQSGLEANNQAAASTQSGAFPDNWQATNPLIDNTRSLALSPAVSPSGIVFTFSGETLSTNTPPYEPSQLLAAYSVTGLNLATKPSPVANQGQGQTIAIIDAQGQLSSAQIQADLETFAKSFAPAGYPAPKLFIHQMNPSTVPNPGFTLEIALDVEWAYAMAPAANIVLVQAATANGSADGPDLMAAVDFACSASSVSAQFPGLPAPSVVSMSFGGPEFGPPSFSVGETASDFHFNHPGITCLASSGDSGDTSQPPSVQWPAASPFVTAVGGTSVALSSTGARLASETAWADLAVGDGASGGGPSAFEVKPSFQSGFGPNSSVRLVPDIACLADPLTGVLVICTEPGETAGSISTIKVVGGTSLASPLWAGVVALANAQRHAAGLGPLKTLSADLYQLASSKATDAANLIDILAGSNGDFSATTGYDQVTGLGSPIVRNLVTTLTTSIETPASGTALRTVAVTTASSSPTEITSGSDGNLWLTENTGDKVGRLTTAGAISEFSLPTAGSSPIGIVTGSDGALWVAESQGNKIARITTSGNVTEHAVPTAASHPTEIAAGPDGNLWFSENAADKIGRLTIAGNFTEFVVPTASSAPHGIVAGPDGALWFTETHANKIGRVTTAGVFTEFVVPTAASGPSGITAGPDGNLWFTESTGNKIGRLTKTGTFTEFVVPTAASGLSDITTGPDHNLWFTETNVDQLGQITTSGAIKQLTSGAAALGITAGPDGNLWITEPHQNAVGRIFP